jgi:NADPH-dependent F420 reductase
MRIGIVGGTGREAKGLAVRWARAGHAVAIGSRDEERAKARAAELAVDAGKGTIEGGSNEWAVRDAEVVLVSVPFAAHGDTLRALAPLLAGKIVIDITVPLAPPRVHEVHLPPGESAALAAQGILGPGAHVVAALHHVSSTHLADLDHTVDCDVLVCSDEPRAMETTLKLLGDLGMRGFDAGPLRNAVALESLTPVLLYIGKRLKSPGLGIRITGVREPS